MSSLQFNIIHHHVTVMINLMPLRHKNGHNYHHQDFTYNFILYGRPRSLGGRLLSEYLNESQVILLHNTGVVGLFVESVNELLPFQHLFLLPPPLC